MHYVNLYVSQTLSRDVAAQAEVPVPGPAGTEAIRTMTANWHI